MQPIIGITSFDDQKVRSTYISINVNYPYSVSAAGALPFIIPGPWGLVPEPFPESGMTSLAKAYTDTIDGLLFSGGGDISPYLFGESPSRGLSRMDSIRDHWELALFAAASARGLPIFGICRGCQVVNVALGGTLYQDIPSEVPSSIGHSFEVAMDEPAHYIDLMEGSRLHRMFGTGRVLVNSFHHQAIKDTAPGLIVSARSPDGIIEAVESDDPARFLVAVQFHPEGMTKRFPAFGSLFSTFVEAAAEYRSQHDKA